MSSNKLSASEALFGFCGWLTTREKITTMASNQDAAPIVELIKIFCEANNLTDPDDNWTDKLIRPKEES